MFPCLGGDCMREVLLRPFQGRREPKAPGVVEKRLTAKKNPVWVFPSRVIKKKTTVCRLRFAANYLLRVIFVSAAEPFLGSIRYPRSSILGLYDYGVAALCSLIQSPTELLTLRCARLSQSPRDKTMPKPSKRG
jgi:hypothetical protein